MPVGAQALFDWHARPGAFERLAPPWETLRVVERVGTIHDGDRLAFEVVKGSLRIHWRARHEALVPGRQFRDVQEAGPFRTWRHTHRTEPEGPDVSRLVDEVAWEVPGERLIGWAAAPLVSRLLARMFAFRHARTRHDVACHARHAAMPRLAVAVAPLGDELAMEVAAFLATGGHHVAALDAAGTSRGSPRSSTSSPGAPDAASPTRATG
ncbi:MAG: SRPBCC family protein [Vicinamibacterales bacterium]